MKALGSYLMLGCMWMASAAAIAKPLTLSYSYERSGNLFAYDFKFTLDNVDNSWKSGQQFDSFIVGDGGSAGPQLQFFEFTAVPPGWSKNRIAGNHSGPMLCFGACTDAGWEPVSEGDFFAFSGTAMNELTSLNWSNLGGFNGAEVANFVEVRERPAVSVPEPGSLSLLGLALAALALTRRRPS